MYRFSEALFFAGSKGGIRPRLPLRDWEACPCTEEEGDQGSLLCCAESFLGRTTGLFAVAFLYGGFGEATPRAI